MTTEVPLSNNLIFFCNGKKVVEPNPDPEMTLLTYLRIKHDVGAWYFKLRFTFIVQESCNSRLPDLRLTGTKLGCAEGGCGACTVMVSACDWASSQIRHRAVNACLFPLCAAHGTAITTVEGIGSTKAKLHPVQERIAKAHGSQCGFCTPGIVMSMYALLRNQPTPNMGNIMSALEGNLCRCTGYRPILDGFKTFTKTGCCGGAQNGGNGVGCCMLNTRDNNMEGMATMLYDPGEFVPYDASQEAIFPPELMITNETLLKSVKFVGKKVTWLRPVTLEQLLNIKSNYPEAHLLVGNTEIGIETKFKNRHFPVLVMADAVPELNKLELKDEGLEVGSSVTLARLDTYLKKLINDLPENATRTFKAIVEMLRWFAGSQIRNVAAVGGNIVTGSPISDLNPVFMAAGCKLRLASVKGTRTLPMSPKFYAGYRQTVLQKEEILHSIFIPFTNSDEHISSFKQAQRREDDIAIVNAGMRVRFQPLTSQVEEIHLVFGGMAPTTVMAERTMQKLRNRLPFLRYLGNSQFGKFTQFDLRDWDESLLDDACTSLQEELTLAPGTPGGMEVYRQSLVLSFFFKFFLSVSDKLSSKINGRTELSSRDRSAVEPFGHEEFESTQLYQEVPSGQPQFDDVGRTVAHQSALQHSTGEATYVDDMPKLAGELFGAFIFSQKAHARIVSVDKSPALAEEGIHYVITAEDCHGVHVGRIGNDEELFAEREVHCVGQVIGMVLADTKELAQKGASLVLIVYEELETILTIKDAIAKESFLHPTRSIKNGNVAQGFEKSDYTIEGEMHVGGQEHFYMETQASLVLPKGEHGEMEIWSSCQWITHMQKMVAQAVKVPLNRITVRTKRIGGAFGGKESRSCIMTAVAAVAAKIANCPVRFMLDRDEDIISTGGRHPMLTRYKVGFNSDGKILAMESNFYSNCGFSLDASFAVMSRAMFHCDSVYKIPNICVTGHLCKTNLPSNTAFRGFGIPQVAVVTEAWMNHIALKCKISPEKVRQMNFYVEGDKTHFNQVLLGVTIQRCWDQCLREFGLPARRKDAEEFNKNNRWKKRGIAVNPTKMGVAIVSALFLNAAGALLNVYEDGSVLISHSGTEMGQGLHTKILQIASRSLKIPTSKIHISESSTDKVPNSPPTAGSVSTDLNGMAVKKACDTLRARLEPYIYANPKGEWEDWVRAAYIDRVSLSTTGYYKVDDIGYDWETNSGNAYNYFTYGVAATEVEIDCLTGDHQVIRTHIVMDVGDSLNPAIDIGQIEGAFIQGYGMFVLEDHRITPEGHFLTTGPGTYKIPGFANIPAKFSVSLLTNASNPRAIFSSKGIGEPSLILGTSVFLAIKDAIIAAREESGHSKDFRLDSPATSERIRLACQDKFTQMLQEPQPGTYKPFFIRP